MATRRSRLPSSTALLSLSSRASSIQGPTTTTAGDAEETGPIGILEKEAGMAKLIWMLSQGIIVVGVVIGSASFFGCASSTPPPERSTSEIKRDADRAFEKMKQEEREYRGESGTTR